jgi:hypothetical protein
VTYSRRVVLRIQRGLLKIALDQFPASSVFPISCWCNRNTMSLPTVLTRSDTSTGSLETPDAPRSLCTRNKSSVQPTQLVLRTDGFMHMQSFSVQPPTNCPGSRRFLELWRSRQCLTFTLNLRGATPILLYLETLVWR